MEILIILVLLGVPLICMAIHAFVTDNPIKPFGGDNIEYKAVRHVGGGLGIVADTKSEAKALLANSLSVEGEVGACQYREGGDVKTIIGICYETDSGGKKVEYLD